MGFNSGFKGLAHCEFFLVIK